MAKQEVFTPELLARADAYAERSIPDSKIDDDKERAEEQKGVAAERKAFSKEIAPKLVEMDRRLAPPAAGKYEVTAGDACSNKIMGEFKVGETKTLTLSSDQAAEFLGPHHSLFTLKPAASEEPTNA